MELIYNTNLTGQVQQVFEDKIVSFSRRQYWNHLIARILALDNMEVLWVWLLVACVWCWIRQPAEIIERTDSASNTASPVRTHQSAPILIWKALPEVKGGPAGESKGENFNIDTFPVYSALKAILHPPTHKALLGDNDSWSCSGSQSQIDWH